MPRKPTPKRLILAHAKFRSALNEYIVSKGAVPDGRFHDFAIETPAGRLGISVWDTSIMTRFENVEQGRAFTSNCGCECNPYSGKWNFHFSDDIASLEPAVIIAHFGFYFEKLLAWNVAVTG